MEKLIELLNECMVEGGFPPDWVISGNGVRAKKSYYGEEISEMVIISKKYSFIKRLVEKNKIDRDKVNRDSKKFFVGDLRPRTPRYKLLILLSISDKPIKDLISYLK